MNDNQFEAANPMQLLKEKAGQLLPINDADLRAAHQYNTEQVLNKKADLESQSIELNHRILEAVAGLMAMDTGEVKRLSFASIIKSLKLNKGIPDG